MHLFDAARRFYGGSPTVGGGLPLALGLALADKMAGRRRVTACFFGDGATAEGEFHESLNLAALWRLPVLLLCENNGYGAGSRGTHHAAVSDLTAEPTAHGVPAESVDGMDALAVLAATRLAAGAVRTGESPRFLEFRTYRFRARSMYDPDHGHDGAEVAHWQERDPIDLLAARLRAASALDDVELARIRADAADRVAAAVAAAEEGPLEPVDHVSGDVCARAVP